MQFLNVLWGLYELKLARGYWDKSEAFQQAGVKLDDFSPLVPFLVRNALVEQSLRDPRIFQKDFQTF